MTWEIILGSTVIAAICSGIVSILIATKSNSLQYITSDRKEWREEIRNIAKNLHGAKYKKSLLILTELKVRINAFGKYPNDKDYIEDSHIWEMIDEIEAGENTFLFESQKKILVNYLSLLLKYDWERSKEEVRGNSNRIIAYIFFVMSSMSMAIPCYLGLKDGKINMIDSIFFIVFILLMLLLINWTIIINMVGEFRTIKKNVTHKYIDSFMKYNLLWFAGIAGLGCVAFVMVKTLCESQLISDFAGIVSMTSYLFALLFTFSSQSTSAILQYNYLKAVEKLRDEYERLRKISEEQSSKS